MLTYYYETTADDNGTMLITFPDVPEAVAVAFTTKNTSCQAAEGLETALQVYVDARRAIPPASFFSNDSVTLGVSTNAKILLSDAMVKQGI